MGLHVCKVNSMYKAIDSETVLVRLSFDVSGLSFVVAQLTTKIKHLSSALHKKVKLQSLYRYSLCTP